jgi:hypothetical protein
MRLTVVQGGGIAGLLRTVSADSASLEPAQADALEAMIEDAGLFDLPERLGPASSHPDAFDYELTVEDGERRKTIRASQDALPEQVRALIQWLQSVPGHEERVDAPGT